MIRFAFAAAAVLATSSATAQVDVVQSAQEERWYYVSQPAGNPVDYTNRDRAGVWSVDGANLTFFQRRAALMMLEFDVTLPVGIDPLNYDITEATISAFSLKNPEWPNTVTFEMFAPGYRGAYPDAASFNIVTSPYVGGNNPPTAKNERTPYLLGLDGSDADESAFPNPQAWATGVYDPALVVSTNNSPVEVEFTLDVSNPVVESRLKADIAAGKTRWFISGDRLLAGFPSPPVPNFYQQPSADPDKLIPALTLRVANSASVSDWTLLSE